VYGSLQSHHRHTGVCVTSYVHVSFRIYAPLLVYTRLFWCIHISFRVYMIDLFRGCSEERVSPTSTFYCRECGTRPESLRHMVLRVCGWMITMSLPVMTHSHVSYYCRECGTRLECLRRMVLRVCGWMITKSLPVMTYSHVLYYCRECGTRIECLRRMVLRVCGWIITKSLPVMTYSHVCVLHDCRKGIMT